MDKHIVSTVDNQPWDALGTHFLAFHTRSRVLSAVFFQADVFFGIMYYAFDQSEESRLCNHACKIHTWTLGYIAQCSQRGVGIRTPDVVNATVLKFLD